MEVFMQVFDVGVLLQGEWLSEGLSMRCGREQFTVKG